MKDDELASSWHCTPQEGVTNDYCEAFGVWCYYLHFPHHRSFGGLRRTDSETDREVFNALQFFSESKVLVS